MARQFPLLAINTPQILNVPGALTGYHQLILAFATAPSAGTVLVEYQIVGAIGWTALQHLSAASITSGFLTARADGPIANFRLTFTGLVGGTAPILWVDTQAEPAGLFSGNAALTVQPYTETNVKNGLQYNLRAVWPLADQIPSGLPPLNQRKILFQTGAKQVIVKLRELHFSAEELRIELFQTPTGVTGGTPLTIHNYNGVSPVTTTVAATKGVTTTTNGTTFDAGDPEYFFGSPNAPQRNPGSIPQGRERILPANSAFLVVISNTGTGDARVQYFLDFFEGSPDLPL